MWCFCFLYFFCWDQQLAYTWIVSQRKVYCQQTVQYVKVRFYTDKGSVGLNESFTCALYSLAYNTAGDFSFPSSGYDKNSLFLIVVLRGVRQDDNLLLGPLNSWIFYSEHNPQPCFFYFNKNIVGYGTYLSLNRILTPNLHANDPLYVVNIYQVSLYILLHKELSVLVAYSRGQTSEPARFAYVCRKPHHTYEGIFLLLLLYISDEFLRSAWHISSWAEVVVIEKEKRGTFLP